ncbi:Ankyrin repeat-containing protein, partial [Oryctes borbonicus]
MSGISDTGIEKDAFHQALLNRQFDAAKKLLPKVDINSKDANGNTYLLRACMNDDIDTVKWLIQNGAKTDVLHRTGRNLLFIAIKSKHMDIIRWLADEKLFQGTTYNGQTPLHEAVSMNQLDIVKVLVGAGEEAAVQNQSGKTALDLAHQQNDKNILKWLLTNKSFEILDEAIYEEGKVAHLQSYFDKYGYEFLNAKSLERNTTIAEYAASTHQIEILKWLQSKKIPVDTTLFLELGNQPKQTFNLLLVGETGVGKSTFINAFMNYLNFNTMDEAEHAKTVHSLIPSNFTVTDENFVPQLVKFGSDINESVAPGASATQSARSYVFDAGDVKIRLIDTPGIGDTRGIGKDEENFDRLLTVIGELQDVHGICILLKPNNARLTVLFEYCIKQLLSRLQKDASQNIIFLFTNSRSTFYRPGDTITPLKSILGDIKAKPPHIDIPFKKQNVFCVDNEAFRFLIAKRSNIHFDDDEKDNFAKSW